MATDDKSQRKEIYTFHAPWLAYTLAWNRTGLPGDRFKLAVGSFKEEYSNELKILQLQHSQLTQPPTTDVASTSSTGTGFAELSRCDHPYPATKILWAPPHQGQSSSKGTVELQFNITVLF
jgi:hypothetical protein